MALIVIINDSQRKHRVKVTDKPFIIGRSSRCHLKIEDELVSGQHLSLGLEGNRVIMKDLGSTNGTFLNGAKINHTFLMIGDHITIGQIIIKLDTTAMDREERRAHTRAGGGKTQLQFVSLPQNSTGTATNAQKTEVPSPSEESSNWDSSATNNSHSLPSQEDIQDKSIVIDFDKSSSLTGQVKPPESKRPKDKTETKPEAQEAQASASIDSDFSDLSQGLDAPDGEDDFAEDIQKTKHTQLSQRDLLGVEQGPKKPATFSQNSPPPEPEEKETQSNRYEELADKVKKKGNTPKDSKRGDEVEYAQEGPTGNTQFIKIDKDPKTKKKKKKKSKKKKKVAKKKNESVVDKIVGKIKNLF